MRDGRVWEEETRDEVVMEESEMDDAANINIDQYHYKDLLPRTAKAVRALQ
jgi:hypothetical protein